MVGELVKENWNLESIDGRYRCLWSCVDCGYIYLSAECYVRDNLDEAQLLFLSKPRCMGKVVERCPNCCGSFRRNIARIRQQHLKGT